MAFPATLTLVTVHGQIDNLPGGGGAATVQFTAAPTALLGDSIVPNINVTVAVGVSGTFSVNLPATNDPDWAPTGWQYNVRIHTGGRGIRGTLQLDYQDTDVDLADLLQIDGAAESGVSYLLATQKGVPGGLAALDANGEVIDSAGNLVGSLPRSNGTDDTAVINAALAARKRVVGHQGENYLISAPLQLALSGTLLDMRGCTVTLKSGSNCNMLKNGTAGRLTDVTITGGTWDRGANAGDGVTGTTTHTLFLRKFDRLTVSGLRVTSTAGKYSVAVGDATEVTARDLSFACFSDGIHITGPARGVDIRNINGTTGDDQVSLTPRDWPFYDDVRGDITGVTIDGVNANGSLCAIKATANSVQKIEGISIKNVTGTTTIRPIALIYDPGSGSPATGPAKINGVTLADLDVQGPTTQSWLWLRGFGGSDITIRNARVRYAPTSPFILADQGATIGVVVIDTFLIGPGITSTARLMTLAGAGHIGVLRIERLYYPSGWNQSGAPVAINDTSTITSSTSANIILVS